MNTRSVSFAILTLFLLSLLIHPSAPGASEKKPNPAFAVIQDDPALPRVLLIGDSISIAYTLPTRKLLQGAANLHRIPVNGGPTILGLERIESWLGDKKWDVIHFNWGLHDLKIMDDGNHQVPLKQYGENLRKLVKILKTSKAKLIWANTTPVPEGKVSPPRHPEDVGRYNAAAKKIMEQNKIAVNDLYAYALPRLKEIQRPVNVHFTEKGSMQLAKQVADAIRPALKKEE